MNSTANPSIILADGHAQAGVSRLGCPRGKQVDQRHQLLGVSIGLCKRARHGKRRTRSCTRFCSTGCGGYRKGDRVKSLLDFQFVGANKYVELRQGAPIALTQQALPVGSNHRRKWKKKDDSSDSGSEDDDETYMPASNLVNLPGGGWGKAAGAGNLGGAGGSSGKR